MLATELRRAGADHRLHKFPQISLRGAGETKENLTQRRKDAKVRTKRESLLVVLAFWGWSGSGNVQFCCASGLEVVNDPVNTVFKEILAEVDQEA